MGYPSRRGILSGGLLLTMAVAAGGVGYRGWERGALGSLTGGPAFEPWQEWLTGAYHGPLALVAAAVLAASPHNSQPWRFRVEPDRIQIRADLSRALGPLDPFRRELHIGLGCAIENLMVAARSRAFDPVLTLLPDPVTEPNLVAQVELASPLGGPPVAGPHMAAIVDRHTHRGRYDTARPLPQAVHDVLAARVEDSQTWLELFPAKGDRGRDFVAATVAATEQIVADNGMRQASQAWFRQCRADVDAHRDGISVIASGEPGLNIRMAMALPDFDEARVGQYWIDATRDVHCATAPVFGLIGVRLPRDRRDLLAAGQLWQRLHLEATAQGVAMQPLNQMMEMVDRERQFSRPPEMAERLAAVTGDPGWTTVFAFRAGYATTPALPSPRRGVTLVTEQIQVG